MPRKRDGCEAQCNGKEPVCGCRSCAVSVMSEDRLRLEILLRVVVDLEEFFESCAGTWLLWRGRQLRGMSGACDVPSFAAMAMSKCSGSATAGAAAKNSASKTGSRRSRLRSEIMGYRRQFIARLDGCRHTGNATNITAASTRRMRTGLKWHNAGKFSGTNWHFDFSNKKVPMLRIARIACSAFAVALSAFADVSFARDAVQFSGNEPPGTIVVRTTERRLYFVTDSGRALRYTVGVGRAGKQWYGTTSIVRSSSGRLGLRRRRSGATGRRGSSHRARLTIPWERRLSSSRTTSSRYTARTILAQSEDSSPGDASACITGTSWTSSSG